MHRMSTFQRVVVVLLTLMATTLAGCGTFGTWIATPGTAWGEKRPPLPPDYSKKSSWAALPSENSRAKQVPPGVPDPIPEETARVDVFFLHPTTYFWRWHWNAPINGWLSNTIVAVTLAGQASAFNGSGQIFAPRFRQLTLEGYQHFDAWTQGLDLAYEDVRRAFEYYLAYNNQGKPIILAGHSQGSDLIIRLTHEFFASGPLQERLIASYPVGTRIYRESEESTERVPVCESPNQTGCFATFRSFAPGGDTKFDIAAGHKPPGPPICVNPLTWSSGEPAAPPSANLGTISIPYFSLSRPQPNVVGGQCKDGALWIDPPKGFRYWFAHPDGIYHAYDYELFYMNIREDAARRVRQFFEQHPTPKIDTPERVQDPTTP